MSARASPVRTEELVSIRLDHIAANAMMGTLDGTAKQVNTVELQ